jgi:membrane fusion protein, multidrug efflux system
MKGRGRMILWIVAAVVVASFAFRFWRVSVKESYASISSIQETEGKPVEVVKASKGDLETWTSLSGTVEGSFQYPVISTNSIAVTGVAKKEGDRVKAGDVLIRLEKGAPNPMLLSYDRSLALYEDAKADAERMRALYKEGAVSKQALDKAELALAVAKGDLSNAREGTNLVATHAGVVTSVLVKEGEMANAYAPLMWIARTDSVRVSFEAGSSQAVDLRAGQKAVWSAGSSGDSGTGAISTVDLSADPESHLVRGEASFPNQAGRLIPGTVVSFRVLSGERRGVVRVPADCVVERGGAPIVFALEGAKDTLVARKRAVTIGLVTPDEVEILSGLDGGERVVRFGQTLLEDGDRVKIVRGGEAAAR